MPVCKNPEAPEFFVYAFKANGRPFYVGIGRSSRASDRVRYVRYLMAREQKGKSVKWAAHTRVMAELIRHGIVPELAMLASGLVRAAALAQEKLAIQRLRAEGHVLANRHFNGGAAITVEQVVEAVLS